MDALKAILAGIAIGIGGVLYLKIGGVIGALMFSIGLLTVVCYSLRLYTGMAGFVDKPIEFVNLIVALALNVLGTWLVSLAMSYGTDVETLRTAASGIIQSRMEGGTPMLNAMLRGIGCGILMTFAVSQKTWFAVVGAVMAFILAGFYHSIADSFYFFMGGMDMEYLKYWGMVVLGNFIGCNISEYRILQIGGHSRGSNNFDFI